MKDEIGGSCPWKGCEFVFDLFTETCWSWFIAWSNSSCARVPCLRPWSWTENSRTHSSGLYWYPCSQNTNFKKKKMICHVHVNISLTFESLLFFRFLFDNMSPAHTYYRWKLFSILQVNLAKFLHSTSKSS